jgi:TctA family transporter
MMQFVPVNRLARVTSLDFFGSFALVPVGDALTALLAGMFEASSLLIAGFSLSAVLWTAPLALRRVREAA